MANGKIIFGKQSGGVLSLTFPDGATNTEVMLPESGNLVSVDTAVTDNAIARYDGTTGKLQNSSVIINDNGNLLVGTTTDNGVDKLQVNGSVVSKRRSGASSGYLLGSNTITDSNPKVVCSGSPANRSFIFYIFKSCIIKGFMVFLDKKTMTPFFLV